MVVKLEGIINESKVIFENVGGGQLESGYPPYTKWNLYCGIGCHR